MYTPILNIYPLILIETIGLSLGCVNVHHTITPSPNRSRYYIPILVIAVIISQSLLYPLYPNPYYIRYYIPILIVAIIMI